MAIRRIINALTIALFLFSSCDSKQIDFDQETWNKRADMNYANRKIMINDLMKNHLSIGMSYNELTNLLGQADNLASLKEGEVGYIVEENYGWDIDPVKVKALIIQFNKDSTVSEFGLKTWKR